MASTSESLLIQLKSQVSSDAWTRFVELYTPLIFFWARRVGLQQQDAADLVQDVLTIVYQKMPLLAYDPNRSFRGWLRKLTLNRHYELARKKKLKLVDASHSELDEKGARELAESTWDLNYARQLVHAAMQSMKDDFAKETWEALLVLVSSGRPAAEIAKEKNVSVWTIYAAKTRLMKRLKRELDGLL